MKMFERYPISALLALSVLLASSCGTASRDQVDSASKVVDCGWHFKPIGLIGQQSPTIAAAFQSARVVTIEGDAAGVFLHGESICESFNAGYGWTARTRDCGNLTELPITDAVVSVDLSGFNYVRADLLEWVAKLPNLEVLNLAGVRFDHSAFAALSNAKRLRKLHIEGCRDVNDGTLKLLESFPNLEFVSVSWPHNSAATQFGVAQLRESLGLEAVFVTTP